MASPNASSTPSSSSSNTSQQGGPITQQLSYPISSSSSSHCPPLSPPKAEVDDSPLQKSMDKNKESLKVKLMLRRPINQLVAQGIMPPLKTPPAFHVQRRQLERAKTGDLLKAKIQARPARTELVRQHILLGEELVDPSLAEKQRRLTKCRLADQLNDQLAHRPGPLELIKKNILHTEEPIERAVKEGSIAFRATCEGQTNRPEHPDHYMDEDSLGSSDATSPPSSLCSTSDTSGITSGGRSVSPPCLLEHEGRGSNNRLGGDVLEQAAANAGIVTVMSTALPIHQATLLSPISLGSTTSSLSPLSSISSPPSSSSSSLPSRCSLSQQQQPAPGKDKGNSHHHRKKSSKSKSSAPKTRTIKFHEYKGPPNTHKNPSGSSSSSASQLSSSPVETSYELLLQQQQLLWQLEWQHKYPQIILPASQKPSSSPSSSSSSSTNTSNSNNTTTNNTSTSNTTTPTPSCSSLPPSPSPPAPPPPPPPPLPSSSSAPPADSTPRPLRNLEDMKVSDLKAELKKRSLPVSGPKPQLIERLKPFTEKSLLLQQQQQQQTVNNNNSNNNASEGEGGGESEIETKRAHLSGGEEEMMVTVQYEPDLTEPMEGEEDDREKLVRNFVESAMKSSSDPAAMVSKLKKEIHVLSELAHAKEIEWNSILRLKKLKEEMWERLNRKMRVEAMGYTNNKVREREREGSAS
uniref:MKL/myocardin-like protein 2 n=1 Tax=Cacopsylla melanoneura TaxID=428564 RepID=A0A8D8VM12_9HEMI